MTIEIRNESHANLIARIIRVKATGNYFIYVEDLPDKLTFKEAEDLKKQGYEFVSSRWYSPIEITEAEF
jgi:hypothetical protein